MASQLKFKDVSLTLHLRGKSPRLILDSCSASVRSNTMTAILGPTGSGKTSLLNVLAGRVKANKNLELTGSVRFQCGSKISDLESSGNDGNDGNGSVKQRLSSLHVGYVTQTDYLFQYLTLRESLLYQAYFHRDSIIGGSDEAVDNIIRLLGLYKSRDTLVCNLSGGECKRTSIAKEMLSNPRILFLDEPTSGLDSFTAQVVISNLKSICLEDRIVIVVVHQPNSAIFQSFDNLWLLSEGAMMFEGKASSALSYFTEIGYPVPPYYNPSDHYIDVLSYDSRSVEAEIISSELIEYAKSRWRQQEEKRRGGEAAVALARSSSILSSTSEEVKSGPGHGDRSAEQHSRSDVDMSVLLLAQVKPGSFRAFFTDTGVLLRRGACEIYRDWVTLLVKTATIIFFSVLLALIYRNLPLNQRSIQDRLGLLFFVIINQSFGPAVGVVSVFPDERTLIQQERGVSRIYTLAAYFVARVMVELPLQIISSLLYSLIVYFAVGLQPGINFLFFWLLVMLSAFCSVALGFLISSVARTAVIANSIIAPVLIVLILVGGFYINEGALPPGAEWLPYLSYVGWGFKGLVINEFTDLEFECPPDALACVKTGEQVIKGLSFDEFTLTICFVSLLVIFLGLIMLSYVGIIISQQRYLTIRPLSKKSK